jgi:hypothetical protein
MSEINQKGKPQKMDLPFLKKTDRHPEPKLTSDLFQVFRVDDIFIFWMDI